MKIEFSEHAFEKSLNVELRQNPFNGTQLFHAAERLADRRKSGYDEADSRFSEFCDRA
jgi:hypothetical protein